MEKIFISKSEKDTKKLAKHILKNIKKSELIVLEGDLGAGKTTLSKSLISLLGEKGSVTSPTFTLMNIYETKKMKIYHFDMYRITEDESFLELGFNEIFSELEDDNVLILVEWAENIKNFLPKKYTKVIIEKLSENERRFIINEVNEK